jgi:hypothetical protein
MLLNFSSPHICKKDVGGFFQGMNFRVQFFVLPTILVYLNTVLSSCGTAPAKTREAGKSSDTTNVWNKRFVDSLVKVVQTGDIVLRTGIGPDSRMLCQLNQKDKTYSHAGIVLVEQGQPFIYHCVGGEDNPDERMRRDPLKLFLEPAHCIGFGVARYIGIPAYKEKIAAVVQTYYQLKPKFDLKFDLKTDDELYCSEFIYKAFVKATGDTSCINVSTGYGRRFVGIDDLFMNPHVTMIVQTRFK